MLQPLLYRKVRGVIPSPQMTVLAQTLTEHPDHGQQVHSLDLTMNELDVKHYSGPAGLRLARSQARDTATIILQHAQPCALTITLVDVDSEHILTSVHSNGLEELTLRASVDGSRPPKRGLAVSWRWLACVGRVVDTLRVLKLEGLANYISPIEREGHDFPDADEASRNERHDAEKALALVSCPRAPPNLQLIVAQGCGFIEQFWLWLRLSSAPNLRRADLSRIGVEIDFALEDSGSISLTHLTAATPHWRDEINATISHLATACANLQQLRLCAQSRFDVPLIPETLASLATPSLLPHLRVLAFSQCQPFADDIQAQIDTWRTNDRPDVEVRLQLLTVAEFDRL